MHKIFANYDKNSNNGTNLILQFHWFNNIMEAK